jgi:hypothetical protein
MDPDDEMMEIVRDTKLRRVLQFVFCWQSTLNTHQLPVLVGQVN